MEKKTLLMMMMMALLLATSLVAYPTMASEEDDSGPIVDPNIRIEEPLAESPEAYDYDMKILKQYEEEGESGYFRRCMMSWDCGREIYEEMLQNKRASDSCCLDMLTKGKECHVEIAKFWFSLYELKKYASRALPRTFRVWNRCYRDLRALAPFPN